MTVLGVDPGGSTTGVVVRSGRRCLDVALVTRGDDMDDYLAEVVDTVQDLDRAHACRVVALESLVEPTPHMGLTSVRGLLDCAQVIGAVRHALHGDVVMVRPAGHGAVPRELLGLPGETGAQACRRWLVAHYPAELLGDGETRGTGRLRHARAAWDVAGSREVRALRQLRLEGA